MRGAQDTLGGALETRPFPDGYGAWASLTHWLFLTWASEGKGRREGLPLRLRHP